MNEQIEQITKPELIAAIRSERESLKETLSRVREDQMTQPGVEAEWSIKDILAHIVAWERRMIRWVGEALSGEVPEIPKTWDQVDEMNEQSYREDRDRPLDGVLAAFRDSYQEALRTAEGAPEQDLVDADRFEWREGVPLWRVVAANTCWHYKEHGESIQEWLESQEQV